MNNETIKLTRDVDAIQVPFGTRAHLTAGTEAVITQALGGTFTVVINNEMFRIEQKDADALGKEIVQSTILHNENHPLEDKIWAQLRCCYDPEIPVNIVDLGLIYGIDVTPTENNKHNVNIRMTLTAPGCGMGPIIAEEAQHRVAALDEVANVTIEMVFDPPWDRSMMSDQAKLELGMF